MLANAKINKRSYFFMKDIKYYSEDWSLYFKDKLFELKNDLKNLKSQDLLFVLVLIGIMDLFLNKGKLITLILVISLLYYIYIDHKAGGHRYRNRQRYKHEKQN